MERQNAINFDEMDGKTDKDGSILFKQKTAAYQWEARVGGEECACCVMFKRAGKVWIEDFDSATDAEVWLEDQIYGN